MARLLPKSVPETKWKQFSPNRVYAIRCFPEDTIYLRLGAGRGFILELIPNKDGRIINSIDFDSGVADLLHRLGDQGTFTVGRSSSSTVRVAHGFVSRKHVEIFLDKNVLLVTDLGSVNGTFCVTDNISFDVERYMTDHPIQESSDQTMDAIHEAFGPMLDDFLKRYSQKKEK